MSITDIPPALRSEVIERAQRRCEYCQKPDDRELNAFRHELDHVVAEKHGGKTESANLAYACFPCNRYKGSDLTSIDPQTGEITRLLNPRTHKWDDHFQLKADGAITPHTLEGRATTRLLRFNDPERVQQRADLIAAGKMSPKRVEQQKQTPSQIQATPRTSMEKSKAKLRKEKARGKGQVPNKEI